MVLNCSTRVRYGYCSRTHVEGPVFRLTLCANEVLLSEISVFAGRNI